MPSRPHIRSRLTFPLVLALTLGLGSASATAATITVDTLADAIVDDGACALREALTNANNNWLSHDDCAAGAGADTIAFDAALFSGTPPSAEISLDPALGRLYVSAGGGLTLAPPVGSRLVLAGNGSFQLLALQGSGDPFTARDIELRNGRASFGAALGIVQSGAVTLERMRFAGNVATGFPGGGAIAKYSSGGGDVLTIVDSSFVGNSAETNLGGALLLSVGGDFDVVLQSVRFEDNAAGRGGAFAFIVDGLDDPGTPELDISDSRFIGNVANYGGALALRVAGAGDRLSTTISNSAFDDNSAANGGGAVQAEAPEQASGFALAIDRGSFAGNVVTGGSGGALQAFHVDLEVTNSAFVRNASSFGGAAIASASNNSLLPRAMHLAGNTFFENAPTNPASANPRTLQLSAFPDASAWNWTIAGNVFVRDGAIGGSALECGVFPDVPNAPQIDGGSNVSDHTSCVFSSADVLDDAALVLAAGSPPHPWVLLPQQGSPTIDLWPAPECTDAAGAPLASDLRGEARPRDGDGDGSAACDAGAFELPDAGTVSVSRSGTGSGRVVSAPAGIDCGGQCALAFGGGTEVTLTAAAAPGSVFAGWSGDCSGTSACVLVVAGDRSATATFDVAPSHTLDVQHGGDGHGHVASAPSGIACAPLCEASFAEGASVSLVAQADADSEFTGWSGGGCSGSGDCTLVLSGDTTVTANFSATAFALAVQRTGSGSGSVLSSPAGIDCPGSCAELFARDTVVTLGATASGSSAFVGWEGDCTGSGDCVLTMDAVHAVDARFELLRTLTVTLAGGGSGTIESAPSGIACPGDCSEGFVNGSEIVLTAQAALGSVFAGWSGSGVDCPGSGPCTVAMASSRSVTAAFQTASYALTVAVDGGGQVASSPAGIQCPADCSEVYVAGSVIELAATPAPGFTFDGWTGACNGTGTCQVTMDAAKSVGATFVANTIEVFANGFE